MELSRRYSNHVDQTNVLLRTLELVRSHPTSISRALVSPRFGRAAPPDKGRAAVDPRAITTSYLGGSTLIELADENGVSASTIKRVLRDEGATKYQRKS